MSKSVMVSSPRAFQKKDRKKEPEKERTRDRENKRENEKWDNERKR